MVKVSETNPVKLSETEHAGKKTFAFLITLSTHGPYKDQSGDGGEEDYKQKLATAMQDFLQFQEKVIELSQRKKRPVVFLIFGDHKPAMTISFYKRHVFNDDFFSVRGSENSSFVFSDLKGRQRLTYGRVPLFVKAVGGDNSTMADRITNNLQDRPIYCLPGALAENLGIYNDYYLYLNKACQSSAEDLTDSTFIKKAFQEEIYGNLLFD